MIDSQYRAQTLISKMKHFGLSPQEDQEEIRQLLNNLILLSEVVGSYDDVSFTRDPEGNAWWVVIKANVSKTTVSELMSLLSEE